MDFSQFSKDDLIDYAEQNSIEIDKRWSVERIAKAIEATEERHSPSGDEMSAIALRIWEGQSPDLPLRERVTRIKTGLARQGFTKLSGLTLPTKEDYKRYL